MTDTPDPFPDTDKGWRDAIEDACLVSWVPITTPRDTIRALIFFEQELALNPTVSEAAAKLHNRIKDLEDERNKIDALCDKAEAPQDSSVVARVDWLVRMVSVERRRADFFKSRLGE